MEIVHALDANSLVSIASRSITSTIIIVQAARCANSALYGTYVKSVFNSSPVGVRAVLILSALHAATFLDVTVWDAAVNTVLVEGTVVNAETNFSVTALLAGSDSAGGTILGTASVSDVSAVVTLSVGTAVREVLVLAIRVGRARAADTSLADGLSRDFSSVESTTVVVVVTGKTGSIGLTVLASRAHGVGVARTSTDTGGHVADGLSGNFSSISGSAVSIGFASNANSVTHAVVALSSDTVSVR
jgi:hypothetical protein